jgi:hypothetical protein
MAQQNNDLVLAFVILFCAFVALLLFAKVRKLYLRKFTPRVHTGRPVTSETTAETMSGNLVLELTDVPITRIYDMSKVELGRGATAHVVIGVHAKTLRRYAIKIIDSSHTHRHGGHAGNRYEREKNILRDIDHTNVVRLFEVSLPVSVCVVVSCM